MKQPGLNGHAADDRTGISTDVLNQVGRALSTAPADFDAHPKIVRHLEAKRAMFESGQGIDWATGEALAFGSLMVEGQKKNE